MWITFIRHSISLRSGTMTSGRTMMSDLSVHDTARGKASNSKSVSYPSEAEDGGGP